MKRWMGALLALLLACMPALAWAEYDEDEDYDAPGDAFEDTWVCGRATLEIEEEDGEYRVEITWEGSASEDTEWRYACTYDEAANALVGEGEKRVVAYGEDGEAAASETVYTGGGATFTLDDEGRLRWADAVEDAGADMPFERLEPEGDDDGDDDAPDPEGLPYVGFWESGEATLRIGVEDGGYTANVRVPSGPAEAAEWVYACDVDEGALVGYPGEKYLIESNDQGLDVASVEVYDDGMAVFTLAPDGGLTWKDEVEDAGRDLVFRPAEDPEAE